ncbi:MAG: YggS family pyridoxal phosphate-dependent enzyme [Elusimicrobia bacterium]|nr:YggS family pyridoxal phosphate-dependent enzyme [Elusimicrobiota bacterium]
MILDNIRQIRYRIAAAAKRAGRDPNGVTLIAVTKYAKQEQVLELLQSGEVREIAENRVQDASARRSALGGKAGAVVWRLIGHLQSNKAKKALEVFDAVDSLDSLKLAEALEKASSGTDRKLPVLIQVKLSGKETQSGVAPEAVGGLIEGLKPLEHLAVRGLMAIAPNVEPVEAVRPHFRRMRELFERNFSGVPGAQLSLGMSRDFELAVEEGATHVRVGTSIFS